MRAACAALVAERHLIIEDVEDVVARAGRLWDFIQEMVNKIFKPTSFSPMP